MMMLIDSRDRSSRDGRLNRKKMLCAFAAVPSLKTMKKILAVNANLIPFLHQSELTI
jgi:hypothetical protein